ncbi:DNA cytosine methyltransferase [Pseudoalteromonas xiamenensis]|uniref:DNA cytosine methyltransferase n=1 Tax=Pseudoalteromonas xiamenensis TaxID=882626 RepID=UPI0035E8AC32
MPSSKLIIDYFAGGGGASTGIESFFGRPVDIAINHCHDAIDMHKKNHPNTKHYCEDVWDVDPVEACQGKPIGFGWFSPNCTHYSKARAGKPVDKRIRGLAWIILKWAGVVELEQWACENVTEFRTWGPLMLNDKGESIPDPARAGETYDAFIKCLTTGLDDAHPAWPEIHEFLGPDYPYKKLKQGLGYNLEYRTLVMSDYGVPTTRERLFIYARKDGCTVQWPTPSHGPVGSGLLPVRTAAEIIDWSIPTKSIFGRKKALAPSTLRRIALGLKNIAFSDDKMFIVPPELLPDSPITSCYSPEHEQDVITVSHIAKHYTGVTGSSLREPLHTVTATDHNALVTCNIVKFRGDNVGHSLNEPLQTISAGGNHFAEVRAYLVKFFGTATAAELTKPLGSITTRDRYALVTIHGDLYQIVDIGMRMLEPHELYAAMGFPANYQFQFNTKGIKNTKQNQVARCGNAVCPTMAELLVKANFTYRTDKTLKHAA